jgi:protoporphyrinogen oxidase
MILSLPPCHWSGAPGCVPQRRRVIVVGATEAGVSAAFYLGVQAVLLEERDIESEAAGVSRAEQPGTVRRWELPQLTGEASTPGTWTDLLSALRTVTRAETRLGVAVTAIDTIEHRIQVSTGESFVYDKLVSTLRLPDLHRLILDENPGRSCSAEAWRYWLIDRDIELLDQPTQQFWGDLDGRAAGKRVAETVYRALTAKYSAHRDSRPAALFQPRIVSR